MERMIACKEWFVEHGVRQGLILINMALSFSHIHDLALHNGQALWQADLYPAAIDAVQAYALHKMRTPRLDALATAISWTVFLLFCGISLAANLLDAPVHSLTGYFVAVLPALALVVVTAMGHLHPAPAQDSPEFEKVTETPRERKPSGAPTGKRERAQAIRMAALAEFNATYPTGGTYKELAAITNAMRRKAGLRELSERSYSNVLAAARP